MKVESPHFSSRGFLFSRREMRKERKKSETIFPSSIRFLGSGHVPLLPLNVKPIFLLPSFYQFVNFISIGNIYLVESREGSGYFLSERAHVLYLCGKSCNIPFSYSLGTVVGLL